METRPGETRAGRARTTALALALAASVLAPGGAAAQQGGQANQPPPVPGPTNTIVDVPGIKVGQYTRFGDGYRSGTTVILPDSMATTGYSQLGGAPGTKETDLLKPGGSVTQVNAVVLSGGSAYGLDTTTGVMRWLEERNRGYRLSQGVVPIVPAAILLDLGRGGDFKKRPDAEFGYAAVDAATSNAVEQGRAGAGMGAGWGLGSASVVLPNGYIVGAIVGLNPAGSPVDPRTCLPYGYFLELGKEFNLVPPTQEECAALRAAATPASGPNDGSDDAPSNTTIALVATNAPLDQTQAERMAMISNSGLARSIRPIHSIGDGDVVFGMATTPPSHTLTNQQLNQIYNAAADALGRAVVHAILASKRVGTSRLGYCEQYPTICRLRTP
ncbi:MAG TPA: P1 family peptidase [Longimicrobiales bacterium]|nr:P1 family peptidase [Longimicrobiales bacterium]